MLRFPSLICGLNLLQLVCFGDNVEKMGFGDVIVVVNHSNDNEDKIEDNPKSGMWKVWIVVFCQYDIY